MNSKRPLIFRVGVGLFIVGAGLLSQTGCDSSHLESGYRVRPLSSNENQRKAYYAPEYSREALQAEHASPGNAPTMGRGAGSQVGR